MTLTELSVTPLPISFPRTDWTDYATFKGEKMQVDCLWLNGTTKFTGLFGVGMGNTGGSNEYLKAPKLKISKLINHSSQHQLL